MFLINKDKYIVFSLKIYNFTNKHHQMFSIIEKFFQFLKNVESGLSFQILNSKNSYNLYKK